MNSLLRKIPVLVFVLWLTGAITAQVAGGLDGLNTRWGGNNFIVGTVFWPSGKRVDTRMGLRLRSLTRSDILSNTDDSGRFIFSHLPAGYYEIIIEGDKEFETVTQAVEILNSRESVPQSYAMSIRLVDKMKPAVKSTVVNIENVGVPKRAIEFYGKASDLAKAGDHRAAIGQLELAIIECPKFMNAFNEMGVQYLRLNELEKADAALQSALKIRPDAFEPMMNRGIALFRLNRHAEAEQVLLAALKIKASAVARYYLGRSLIKLGRNDEAEKELIIAVEIGADEFKEAHRLLAVIYLDRGDRQKVVEQLETYLRLVPLAPDAGELRQVIQQNKTPGSPTPTPDTKPSSEFKLQFVSSSAKRQAKA